MIRQERKSFIAIFISDERVIFGNIYVRKGCHLWQYLFLMNQLEIYLYMYFDSYRMKSIQSVGSVDR